MYSGDSEQKIFEIHLALKLCEPIISCFKKVKNKCKLCIVNPKYWRIGFFHKSEKNVKDSTF